jgi:PAS domain S-box-containing protein
MSEPKSTALHLAQLALLGEASENLKDAAVFVWDDDRQYVAVNEAACKLTGLDRDALLGMRVGDLSPDRGAPHFENVQRDAVHSGSSSLERADGTIEIDWVTCHTRVAGLPYMVSICWRKGEQ